MAFFFDKFKTLLNIFYGTVNIKGWLNNTLVTLCEKQGIKWIWFRFYDCDLCGYFAKNMTKNKIQRISH